MDANYESVVFKHQALLDKDTMNLLLRCIEVRASSLSASGLGDDTYGMRSM
jgi:hypothetical protein